MTDLLGIKERGDGRRAACQSGRLCYYSLRVGWRHGKEAEEVVVAVVELRGWVGCTRQEEGSPSNPPIFLHYCFLLLSSLPPCYQACRQMKPETAAGSEIDLKE